MSDFALGDVGEGLLKAVGLKGNSAQKKEKSAAGRGRMWALKWFVAAFAFIFAVEAFVYLVAFPSMQRVTIIWSGERFLSVADLSRIISPLVDKSWAKFDEVEASARLLGVSGIEDVQVVKRFPDKVYINVREREAVAMTLVSDGSRSVPVQIDKNGVIFTRNSGNSLDESLGSDINVPLISGIPVESVSGRMRIPAKYRGLLEQIAFVRGLSQNYFAAISEIHIVPKEYGNYELVLYPIHGRVRVLTGRQLTEEALQYMMVALDVVNTIEPNVSEIDLRYGSIAYRTRSSANR